MRHHSSILAGIVAVMFGVAGPFARFSDADVLLNTFGPDDSYDLSAAFTISGGSEAFGVYYAFQSLAVPFIASYGATLDRLTVGSYYYANRDLMKVSLMTSDNAGLPGTVLESFTGSFGTPGAAPPAFNSALHPSLTAGVKYWVAVEAGASDALGILNGNNLGITQVIAHHGGNPFYGWEYTGEIRVPAVRVEATPAAPQPGDFNADGFVNAADYVVWRKNPGGIYIIPDDFNIWRAHFGEPSAGGANAAANAAIPEPASLFMIALAVLAMYAHFRPAS